MKASSGEEAKLSETLSKLHEELMYAGYHSKFSCFLDKLTSNDTTWKFWIQFVFQDVLAYVSLYLAIRSAEWELRMASIKLMAPIFSAFHHLTYRRLIAQHLADVSSLLQIVLNTLRMGEFVVSLNTFSNASGISISILSI